MPGLDQNRILGMLEDIIRAPCFYQVSVFGLQLAIILFQLEVVSRIFLFWKPTGRLQSRKWHLLFIRWPSFRHFPRTFRNSHIIWPASWPSCCSSRSSTLFCAFWSQCPPQTPCPSAIKCMSCFGISYLVTSGSLSGRLCADHRNHLNWRDWECLFARWKHMFGWDFIWLRVSIERIHLVILFIFPFASWSGVLCLISWYSVSWSDFWQEKCGLFATNHNGWPHFNDYVATTTSERAKPHNWHNSDTIGDTIRTLKILDFTE